MGRPKAVYPAELCAERDCRNCGEPFTPAKEGWQALYCKVSCWRANNGGPARMHPKPVKPPPSVTTADPFVPRAEVEQREAFVQQVAAALEPPRLVIVGAEHCPRCDTTHSVYGYRGRAGA